MVMFGEQIWLQMRQMQFRASNYGLNPSLVYTAVRSGYSNADYLCYNSSIVISRYMAAWPPTLFSAFLLWC